MIRIAFFPVLLFIALSGLAVSQTEQKPYVHSFSAGIKYFDNVRDNSRACIGWVGDEKTKFKYSDVLSALVEFDGVDAAYDTSRYEQIIMMGLSHAKWDGTVNRYQVNYGPQAKNRSKYRVYYAKKDTLFVRSSTGEEVDFYLVTGNTAISIHEAIDKDKRERILRMVMDSFKGVENVQRFMQSRIDDGPTLSAKKFKKAYLELMASYLRDDYVEI